MVDNDKIIENIKNRISVKADPFPYFFLNDFLPIEIAKKAENEFVQFSQLMMQEMRGIKKLNLFSINMKKCQ